MRTIHFIREADSLNIKVKVDMTTPDVSIFTIMQLTEISSGSIFPFHLGQIIDRKIIHDYATEQDFDRVLAISPKSPDIILYERPEPEPDPNYIEINGIKWARENLVVDGKEHFTFDEAQIAAPEGYRNQ